MKAPKIKEQKTVELLKLLNKCRAAIEELGNAEVIGIEHEYNLNDRDRDLLKSVRDYMLRDISQLQVYANTIDYLESRFAINDDEIMMNLTGGNRA